MKHPWRIAILALSLLAVTAAVAQTAPAATPNDNDINRTELRNLDIFLDRNPQIASDLKANPSLINDPTYQQNHPQLQQFLSTHPGVSEEAKENPQRLFNRERRYDNQGYDITRKQDASLDNFLDSHPKVMKALYHNPSLANDPNFLAKHPEFQQYLNNHPGVAKEFKENPKAVMRSESRYEKTEQDWRQDDRRERRATLRQRNNH